MCSYLVSAFLIVALLSPSGAVAQALDGAGVSQSASPIVIQSFKSGLSGVCAANAGLHLSLSRDRAITDAVLVVEYPMPSRDPAGRDVRCAAENQDWSAGRAIAFQIKPDHAMRFSLSFVDRNRVAYTTWTELKGGVWQLVRIPFDEIQPNPYFQPPDAKTGLPIDVSDVKGVAFSPQDRTSGRLTIGPFVVVAK